MNINKREQKFLIENLIKNKRLTYFQAKQRVLSDNRFLKEMTKRKRAENKKHKKDFLKEFKELKKKRR
mgnify:CR=1 FL=1